MKLLSPPQGKLCSVSMNAYACTLLLTFVRGSIKLSVCTNYSGPEPLHTRTHTHTRGVAMNILLYINLSKMMFFALIQQTFAHKMHAPSQHMRITSINHCAGMRNKSPSFALSLAWRPQYTLIVPPRLGIHPPHPSSSLPVAPHLRSSV